MKLPSDYANDMAAALERFAHEPQEDAAFDGAPFRMYFSNGDVRRAKAALDAYREWQSRLSGRVVPLRAESSASSPPSD